MVQPKLLKKFPGRWYEKAAALIALVNLGLVCFNLSYVPLRSFYQREARFLVSVYDPIKGIEPHRDTQRYLATVNQLERQLAQSGPQGSQVSQLLADLRDQSVTMIDQNPFAIANKTGTLEKIKNRMRDRLGEESAKQAFRRFWSQPQLASDQGTQQLEFFNREIRPLMATNFYRGRGENGEFIDRFWRIDLFFITFFALEFLIRTYYLHRQQRGTSWLDTMFWRWYDLLLLLPFWRWLRIIPVTVRLHQVGWLRLERVQAQLSHSIAASLAAEVTDMVFVGIINQAKSSIHQGELADLFSQSRQYVEINDVNELEAIASRLLSLSVYNVYPKIQADLEAFLSHTIASAISQTAVYRRLQYLPAMGALPTELGQQLAPRLSQGAYDTLTNSLEDQQGGQLLANLTQHFGAAFGAELQKAETLQEIQALLLALLEEVKLTYLQHSTAEDLDQTLSEVAQVYQVAHKVPAPSQRLGKIKLRPPKRFLR